jgi:hypothetical protein
MQKDKVQECICIRNITVAVPDQRPVSEMLVPSRRHWQVKGATLCTPTWSVTSDPGGLPVVFRVTLAFYQAQEMQGLFLPARHVIHLILGKGFRSQCQRLGA